MDIEQAVSSRETLGRAQRMVEVDLPKRTLCPCGEESVDTCGGLHVIGAQCRDRVARHVRRRFGPHKFAGRYAADVEDMIQDCYRKLLAPGGLDNFQSTAGRAPADAFRAWLWSIVHYHCNNKLDYFRAHPGVGGDPSTLDGLPEMLGASTPEQEFARRRILDIIEVAIAAVEPAWRAKGPLGSERFDVLVALVKEETDAKRASERLDVEDNHLNQLKWKFKKDLVPELRRQVLDDLLLPPGLEQGAIELRIDQEIGALFQAAYPASSVLAPFSSETETDAESKAEQPESKR